MSTDKQRLLRNLRARLDREALQQLRAECARLAERIDSLEYQLHNALDDADTWRDHAAEMAEFLPDNIHPALAIDGTVGLIEK
jgi:hypothetical protein